MSMDPIREAIGRARDTGYRALLFLHGNRRELVEWLAGKSGGDCILVGDSSVRGSNCRLEVSPARYQGILGSEAGAAIISLPSLVRPSLIAAAGETVRGGGFLAIVGGEPGEWTPGPREGLGAYEEYLYHAVSRNRLHIRWSSRMGILSWRMEAGAAPEKEWDPRDYIRGKRLAWPVKRLVLEARTRDQAVALERMHRFAHKGGRSFLLTGDRGRGKSYVIGLLLAGLVAEKYLGRASIVSPTLLSCQSVFAGLLRGLRALGVEPSKIVRSRGGELVRVSGSWFKISYESPETYEGSPLLVIDEAAALGVARARILSRRASRVIASTTIHGYEGSGLAYARLVSKILPSPREEYRLEEPIRYPRGDPLEEWIYDYMMLRPPKTTSPESVDPSGIGYRVLDNEFLRRDWGMLREIVGLLMQAHYRNTPDYLLLLLETGYHEIHLLEGEDSILAVADVVREPEAPGDAATASKKLVLYSGPVGNAATGVRVARVSRIAVHPSLQRRGLGSRLLASLEEYYSSRGYDAVASIFSRLEVLAFWRHNGYSVYYVSPRYNRVTGEKNVGVAKPLSPERGQTLVRRATCNMLYRLLLAGPDVYRDLPVEALEEILSSTRGCTGIPAGLSENMAWRLGLFCRGELGAEQAWDSMRLLLLADPERLLAMLSESDARVRRLAVARLVGGRNRGEAARIAGLDEDEADRLLGEWLRLVFCPATGVRV